MRILYVVRGLNQSSGTTHAVIPMAEEMARRGHEVWLYSVRKPAGIREATPDPVLVHTRIFNMSLPLDNPGFSTGFAGRSGWISMISTLSTSKQCGISSHGGPCAARTEREFPMLWRRKGHTIRGCWADGQQ